MDKEYSLTIEKAKSVLNDNLVLCQYETGIDIYFRLINCPHLDITKNKYTYSQLRLLSPSQIETTSDICPIIDGKVIFSITTKLIESLEEGNYKGYIIIFDDRGRTTVLPPIDIKYKEYPISGLNFSNAELNSSNINSNKVYKYAEEIPFYNADGTYNRTLWVAGDIITDARLNKSEQVVSDLVDYKLLSKQTFEKLEKEKGYTLITSNDELNPIIISELEENSYLLKGYIKDFDTSDTVFLDKRNYCIVIKNTDDYNYIYRCLESDDNFRLYKYDKNIKEVYIIHNDVIKIKSIDGHLKLMTNKYQIAEVEELTEISMPNVTDNFGEINIIINTSQTSTLIFPEINWTTEPNINVNNIIVIKLVYLNGKWFGDCGTLNGIDPTKDRLNSDYDALLAELKIYIEEYIEELWGSEY